METSQQLLKGVQLEPSFSFISKYVNKNKNNPALSFINLLVFVSQVITPEEIVDPNVDEHSVMTYLSQFPKAKLKPGAPLRPKLNPKKARAYGPGTHTHTHTPAASLKQGNKGSTMSSWIRLEHVYSQPMTQNLRAYSRDWILVQ